jgi:hypothetical protein
MKSPLRSAILRGVSNDEQETPQQEAAEKAAPPPPKPGLGALARAIGRGKEVKKVTIIGGAGSEAGKRTHGDKHPGYTKDDGPEGYVWDENKKQYVPRRTLSSLATSRVTIEK